MSKPMKVFIRTVSPIHIGCDEVYEPMGFIIDEERGKLISFDPLDFFRSLDARKRNILVGICKKGTVESLLELYRFMRGKKINGHEVELCKGFVTHYKDTLSLQDRKRMQQELNNLTIFRTAFNPNTNQTYIPGSAIKGSLRTAYLNHQEAIKKTPRQNGKDAAKQLEKFILDGGSFSTDPFRMLKVSDFVPVGQIKTRIVYAVNEKKKISKFGARGPYQTLEIIEPDSLFGGWITVDEPHQRAGIKHPVTRQAIAESLNQFYKQEKSREDKELTEISISPLPIPESDGCLVRIGRHSGAESVTIDGHRSIKIMRGKGEKSDVKDHATTFWLVSEESKPQTKERLKPFGWAILGEVTGEMEKKFQEMEISWQREQQKQEGNKAHDMVKDSDEVKPTPEKPSQSAPSQYVNPKEVWEKASLTFKANDGSITATLQKKRATTKDKTLVPEPLQEELFKKKGKSITASVTVERYGNAFRIAAIKEPEE